MVDQAATQRFTLSDKQDNFASTLAPLCGWPEDVQLQRVTTVKYRGEWLGQTQYDPERNVWRIIGSPIGAINDRFANETQAIKELLDMHGVSVVAVAS